MALDSPAAPSTPHKNRWSRRRFLQLGIAGSAFTLLSAHHPTHRPRYILNGPPKEIADLQHYESVIGSSIAIPAPPRLEPHILGFPQLGSIMNEQGTEFSCSSVTNLDAPDLPESTTSVSDPLPYLNVHPQTLLSDAVWYNKDDLTGLAMQITFANDHLGDLVLPLQDLRSIAEALNATDTGSTVEVSHLHPSYVFSAIGQEVHAAAQLARDTKNTAVDLMNSLFNGAAPKRRSPMLPKEILLTLEEKPVPQYLTAAL